MKIDMNEVSGGSRNLSGKGRGESARAHFRLDEIDRGDDRVTVKFPQEIYAISSSFFLGMFSPSIERLGVEAFQRKYRFIADDVLQQQIQHGIERATMSLEPFHSVA
jgi:hypothetical protein